MPSYQTFTVLSNFCRLINLLSSYQSFVILSNFCYLLFTLSTNHINMYPLYITHTKLWLRCKNISSSPSPTKQAASSQYRVFWFVLQLRPPLIVSGTVESFKFIDNPIGKWQCNDSRMALVVNLRGGEFDRYMCWIAGVVFELDRLEWSCEFEINS